MKEIFLFAGISSAISVETSTFMFMSMSTSTSTFTGQEPKFQGMGPHCVMVRVEGPEAWTAGLSRSGIETASCVASEYTDVIPPYVDSRLNNFVLRAWIADTSYPKFDEIVSSDLTVPNYAG
ncbi:hypothetical protein M434DRAFT_35247 [Hypoxylon sp. CO27-5]|nr:hypothetical protein M434DRAFT_35247 [Hypoxylon sp. CO27-5]